MMSFYDSKMIADILRESRRQLTPENWIKSGNYAVDSSGRPVMMDSSSAVGWCALGMTGRIKWLTTGRRVYAMVDFADILKEALFELVGEGKLDFRDCNGHVTRWNDHPDTTIEEVYMLYDRAIEIAER